MAVLSDKNKHMSISELQELLHSNCWSDTLPIKPNLGVLLVYFSLNVQLQLCYYWYETSETLI